MKPGNYYQTTVEPMFIPITKRHPRVGKKVLVLWKDHKNRKHIDTASKWTQGPDKIWHFTIYDIGGATWLDDSQVIGWMPLPKMKIS